MLAEEYFRDGNLQGALKDLQEQIRNHPENSQYRIFLFQLLAVLGQWKRALNQLNVLSNLEKNATWPMVQTYRPLIQCEVLRAEIFAGRQKPLIFGEPPPWMAWLLESLRLMAEGQHGQAVSLRDQAFDLAAESSGTIDDQPFKWIADADSRLGPVLELILDGRYYWAPIEQIRAINIGEPEDLRDFVWLPAQFTWVNEGQAVGFIPARYPGSENAQDSAIQLARTTQWQEAAEGVYLGLGVRMLATDLDDYPVLNIREVTFSSD
jgi:type VI secretion system protein ImpE